MYMYLPYVGVCSSLDEVLDSGRGARVGCIHERSPALTILDIDIGTQLNQIEQSLDRRRLCNPWISQMNGRHNITSMFLSEVQARWIGSSRLLLASSTFTLNCSKIFTRFTKLHLKYTYMYM